MGISLERRTLICLTLAFAAGAGALALSLYDTRDHLRRTTVAIQAREIAEGFTMQSDPASLPRTYAGGELSYTLYSPSGEVLWFSDDLKRPRRLRPHPDQVPQRPFSWPLHSGEVVNVPTRLSDGATLMVAKRDLLERQAIGVLLQAKLLQSLAMLIPIGLLALGLIYWMMRWTLRPVQEAARFAQGISPQHVQPIPTTGLPREIRPLADAVNMAVDNLAQALANEKRLVADAAHELRTPLTVLDLRLQKARAEAAPDWPSIDADLSTLRQITGQLLLLARQDQHTGIGEGTSTAASTHLSRTVREAAAALLPLFEAQGRELRVHIADAVHCQGEASLLRTAIGNVLENALHHGRGPVSLVLAASTEAIRLTVEDQGAGVPGALQDSMFMRFQKGSQGSRGAGLGLAITRQILRNAGGDARFVPSSGCAVELSFRAPA